ncbi:hypothetical protein EV560_1011 [Bosea sp. BK604]|nr:hypothetical protein EV560_1011 [Bosea sp. BK604]
MIGMSVTIERDAFAALKPAIEVVARSVAIKPGN